MKKYYFLVNLERPATAVAYTIGEPPVSYELIPLLEGKNTLPFDLVLKAVTATKEGLVVSDDLSDLSYRWQDFLPNCLAWPIMSMKMKEVVDANLTGREGIDWISVTVSADGEQRDYYILRFNQALDVIDREKTTFVSGTDLIVKAYFSWEKISGLSLFPLPEPNGFWKIPSGVYVSQTLKDAFEQARLTGIAVEEISSYRIV